MNDTLTLKIVTPVTEYCYENCDSVKFTVSDGKSGNDGGSCGIRKGHAKAVFSLSEGKICASGIEGKILEGTASSGFATVDGNVVTVIVDEFTEV